MTTELLEWRGVHGHSASVELSDEWPADAFAVRHAGWGTDVELVPKYVPGNPDRSGPFAWLHLALASPLEVSSGWLVERVGWPEVNEVSVFFQTGAGALLRDVHVWDGVQRLLTVQPQVDGDFRVQATPSNTWAVNAALRFGLGISLRFSFGTAVGGDNAEGSWITVAGARARFVLQRREPWFTLARVGALVSP